MGTIKLQVGGFSYAGGMAGAGGDEYMGEDNGPESLAVYFRNDNLGAKLSKLGIELFGSHMGKAFLTREQIDTLRTAGVELKETEVSNAGMGNYVLWRVE